MNKTLQINEIAELFCEYIGDQSILLKGGYGEVELRIPNFYLDFFTLNFKQRKHDYQIQIPYYIKGEDRNITFDYIAESIYQRRPLKPEKQVVFDDFYLNTFTSFDFGLRRRLNLYLQMLCYINEEDRLNKIRDLKLKIIGNKNG